MTPAYDKLYLNQAQTSLARMLDFAVHDLEYDLSFFFTMFITSGIAKRFEHGDFTVVAGKSGVELTFEVIELTQGESRRISPSYSADRSREYWTGWALAYYQWKSGLSFADITAYVPIDKIRSLYSPYHEMDIRQFADKMDTLYLAAKPDINLKLRRQKAGLSQKALAELSGVPLRTIQQYEQRQKNINKAQGQALFMLAHALSCRSEDLIEHVQPIL